MIWAERRKRRGWLVTLKREELDTVCPRYRVYSIIWPRGGQLATVLVLTQLSAICMIQIPGDHMNTRQSVKVCHARNSSSKHSADLCLHPARAAEGWRGFWESWQWPVFSVRRVTSCSSWRGSVSRSPESFAIKSLLKNRFYKLVTKCTHSAHDEQILVRQPSYVMKSVLNTRHWSRFILA